MIDCLDRKSFTLKPPARLRVQFAYEIRPLPNHLSPQQVREKLVIAVPLIVII